MATIVEAIKAVLSEHPNGLTSAEIYNSIIAKDLYSFKAENPQAIVNSMVRRHCFGLDFSTASPHKYFKICNKYKGKARYSLYDEAVDVEISEPSASVKQEKTPEELINDVYLDHMESMREQLMNAILNSSPAFFEELVVQLLIKMGYGYDMSSGKVTRYCKDGGIDGIIEEDRLGLDKIYVQAKRYSINNKIDTAAVDQFATAMGKRNVKKGVFITTSSFVQPVIDEYAHPVDGKTIRLIDGDELMNYLIKYEIGVKSVKTYTTYKLDENYFISP